MRFWANLVGYQLIWFAIVISASRGQPMWGIAAALVFITLQFRFSASRVADAHVLVAASICGLLLDGTLVALGWLDYASPLISLPAPVWILALWLAFAMTLNHSMSFLRGKPLIAAVLGGIGGPLAYLGAARGFDAVVFSAPAWHAIALLAVGWAAALASLATLTQQVATEDAGATLQPENTR